VSGEWSEARERAAVGSRALRSKGLRRRFLYVLEGGSAENGRRINCSRWDGWIMRLLSGCVERGKGPVRGGNRRQVVGLDLSKIDAFRC
jgi:hypothetical protein